MSGEVDHRPPRGYSWPQATEGNTLAEKHGAFSPRRTGPVADVLAAELPTVAPWTSSPAFDRVRASWAHAEAQATLLRADVDEHGMFDGEGAERPAVRVLDRVEGRLAKLRDQLGLSPMSLGKLLAAAASVAAATGDEASLAALQAEGRKVLAARLAAGEESIEEDQGDAADGG